jgi:hypothetical protein
MELLQAVVQQGTCDLAWMPLLALEASTASLSVRALCTIPAAQQLDSRRVLQLLEAAVKRGNAGCITRLCALPAAQQLSSGAVVQLLQAANKCSNRAVCTEALCALPALSVKRSAA